MTTNNATNNALYYPIYQTKKFTLTPSDLNNMFASAVNVIDAPGNNYSILIDKVVYNKVFNTAAPINGGNVQLYYTSSGTSAFGGLQLSSTVFTSATSNVGQINPNNVQIAFTAMNNSPVSISNLTAAYTGGDCTTYLTIYYYIARLV